MLYSLYVILISLICLWSFGFLFFWFQKLDFCKINVYKFLVCMNNSQHKFLLESNVLFFSVLDAYLVGMFQEVGFSILIASVANVGIQLGGLVSKISP